MLLRKTCVVSYNTNHIFVITEKLYSIYDGKLMKYFNLAFARSDIVVRLYLPTHQKSPIGTLYTRTVVNW